MFYIKEPVSLKEIEEGSMIQIDLRKRDVNCICPGCGVSVEAEPYEIGEKLVLHEGETAVYCADCSNKLKEAQAASDARGERRELDLNRWAPDEADKPALVAYLKDNYEGVKDCCGDGEEAGEALELYKLVKHNPLRYTKDAIQGHFLDMFYSVGGEIEDCYGKDPEIIRLINLTICPDPVEEERPCQRQNGRPRRKRSLPPRSGAISTGPSTSRCPR